MLGKTNFSLEMRVLSAHAELPRAVILQVLGWPGHTGPSLLLFVGEVAGYGCWSQSVMCPPVDFLMLL